MISYVSRSIFFAALLSMSSADQLSQDKTPRTLGEVDPTLGEVDPSVKATTLDENNPFGADSNSTSAATGPSGSAISAATGSAASTSTATDPFGTATGPSGPASTSATPSFTACVTHVDGSTKCTTPGLEGMEYGKCFSLRYCCPVGAPEPPECASFPGYRRLSEDHTQDTILDSLPLDDSSSASIAPNVATGIALVTGTLLTYVWL